MNEDGKKWNNFIARYYGDSEFAASVDANPTAVLKELGMTLSKGVTVHLHKNSERDIHIILPPNPAAELSEEYLQNFAGAGTRTGGNGTIGSSA